MNECMHVEAIPFVAGWREGKARRKILDLQAGWSRYFRRFGLELHYKKPVKSVSCACLRQML
jgi:hypothetical protein